MKFSEMNKKGKLHFLLEIFEFLLCVFFLFLYFIGFIAILASFFSENCFDFLSGFFLVFFSLAFFLILELIDLEKDVKDIKEQLISLNDFFIDGADE